MIDYFLQLLWACSSVGRAFGSHPRGQGFESLQVHHQAKPGRTLRPRFGLFFLYTARVWDRYLFYQRFPQRKACKSTYQEGLQAFLFYNNPLAKSRLRHYYDSCTYENGKDMPPCLTVTIFSVSAFFYVLFIAINHPISPNFLSSFIFSIFTMAVDNRYLFSNFFGIFCKCNG